MKRLVKVYVVKDILAGRYCNLYSRPGIQSLLAEYMAADVRCKTLARTFTSEENALEFTKVWGISGRYYDIETLYYVE